MLATEHLCWPSDIYCGHWIDGQILADGGTLGKRKPWDSGKFGWSRFDQDVIGVRRWRVRCGLPTIREFARFSRYRRVSHNSSSPLTQAKSREQDHRSPPSHRLVPRLG